MTTHEITTITVLKNMGYIPAIILGLSTESYAILAVLMLIDTITGVIRAGVVHGWRSVNSHNLSFGILSKMCLILVPLIVAMASRGSGLDLTLVAKGSLSAIILSEAYSILGNVQSIRIRKDIQEFDAIHFILVKLRKILEKLLVSDNGKKR
jgi:toxin secretion/phage lysis holin